MHLNWHYHRAKLKSHAHCFHWSTCAHADVDCYCACAVILTLTLLMANLHYCEWFKVFEFDFNSRLEYSTKWREQSSWQLYQRHCQSETTLIGEIRMPDRRELPFKWGENFWFFILESHEQHLSRNEKTKKDEKKFIFFFTRIKMNPSASSSSECAGPMFIGVSKGEKKEKNLNNLNLIKSSHSCLFIVASA